MVALGIDIGTTNTKAVLVRTDPMLRVLAQASAPTPSPGELPRVLADLIGSVTSGNPPPAALGIASMAETGVPLDSSDQPLGGWIGWDGAHARAQAASLDAELSGDMVFALTGTRLSPKAPLAVWRWLAATDPERWQRLLRWAGVADLAGLALTGTLVTDHSLAGRTAAYRLDGASTGATNFDQDLLSAVGLRPDQLPTVSTPAERLTPGSRPEWSDRGLPAGTPVVVAGHDHAVGAWAAGVRNGGQVADSLGTAEAVYTVLPSASTLVPEQVREQGMSVVTTLEGATALLAGHPSAGAMVRWWLQNRTPFWTAEELAAAASEAKPSPGAFITPYPHGRQSPSPDPAARVTIHGLDPTDGDPERARALFEGLALQAAWMVRVQGELAGQPARSVVALGGPAASNQVWMHAKARQLPSLRHAVSVREPVAAGAALFALHTIGAASGALPMRDLPPAEPTDPGSLPRFIAAATKTTEKESA
ncbi:MAG: carbohydrate kinase [Actinobacteria bacterium]|nr:carbohydrate kinase [Actinomycetota bacterium]